MRKYLFFMIFVLILGVHIEYVWAEECTEEKITSLKEQANNITYSVEFDYDGVNLGYFDQNFVSFVGINEDLYVTSKDYSVGFFYSDSVDGVVTKGVGYGNNTFVIRSNSCPDTILKTINLDLKKYNIYSQYEECDGISGEELDVCNEFYEKDLDYDEFVKAVNNYKSTASNDDFIINGNLMSKYWYVMVIAGVFLVLIIAFVIYRNIKRSKLD